VVIRSKENLVAIRPREGLLAMETMLFADEVVPTDSLDELTTDGNVKTTERELTMARQLIDSLSSDFEPEKYHDEYRERVLDLIERKAQGETIVIEEPAAEPEKVPDLMAALEASIAASKPAPKKKPAPKRKAPAKKKAAAKT
jgi:DNA end-binding protein Ku